MLRLDELRSLYEQTRESVDVVDADKRASLIREARRSTVGTGMGYVLGDGIGCYDLDHCITDGALDSWAQEVLDSITDPLFVEVSQSGAGLHVFVRTSALAGKVDRRDDGYSVEFYPNRRYIAVTGRAYQR